MTWSRGRSRSGDYDWQWQKTRKQWVRRHQPSDPCVRCAHPLGPMGRNLHLDHDDHDRSIVLGFARGDPCPYCGVPCNKRAGTVKGSAIAHGKTPTFRRRDW